MKNKNISKGKGYARARYYMILGDQEERKIAYYVFCFLFFRTGKQIRWSCDYNPTISGVQGRQNSNHLPRMKTRTSRVTFDVFTRFRR